jgi:HK97 family phage prohead protease
MPLHALSTRTDRRRRQQRFAALDLKSVGADGIFEGYASLFNREDLGHDIIQRGAFRESIANRGAAGIKMLFQHDPAEVIGVWETIREDAKGLFVRGRLLPGIARAREVLALLQAGAVDGLSIGFRAVRARRDPTTRVRRIEAVDLWEISIVTFPMLPEARISTIASTPRRDVPVSEKQLVARLAAAARHLRSPSFTPSHRTF